MKFYLIGMPGSGKSTLGLQLAEKLVLPFVDLDSEIEKEEGKSVKEIFSEYGEDYFRRAESKALKRFAYSAQSFVLATGGGAPCFYDGIKIINSSGPSIFLDVPIAEIITRVEHDKSRPLLSSSDKHELKIKLENLLKGRLEIYNNATIKITEPEVDNVLHQIRKYTQP